MKLLIFLIVCCLIYAENDLFKNQREIKVGTILVVAGLSIPITLLDLTDYIMNIKVRE